MINSLKFEWRKLWQSKAMYIIFSLGLISITLMMILSKTLSELTSIFSSPDINATSMLLTALTSGSFITLLGIYIALFACQDYTQHTIKNIYARGYSRTAVYFSKYLVSLWVTFVVAMIYMLYSFLLAAILGAPVHDLADYQWGSFALQFLWLIGIHGLLFGLSTMIGRVGISVAVNLVGVSICFSLLDLLISLIFSGVKDFSFKITDYQLDYILVSLMGTKLTQAELVRAIVMPIVYAGVFVTGGWLVSKRRDV